MSSQDQKTLQSRIDQEIAAIHELRRSIQLKRQRRRSSSTNNNNNNNNRYTHYLKQEYNRRLRLESQNPPPNEQQESHSANSQSPLNDEQKSSQTNNQSEQPRNNIPSNSPSSANLNKKSLSSISIHLKEHIKLEGHGNKVYSCDWHPTRDNNVCSAGRDGKLIFWNIESGHKRLAYPLETEFVMALKYSPDGQQIACGGLDDTLSIYPVNDNLHGIVTEDELNKITKTYKYHSGYISCIQWMDKQHILTASGDSSIIKWDLNQFQPSTIYKVHRSDVMSISINPTDPNLLLSGSVDSTAKIIDFRLKNDNSNSNSHSNLQDQKENLNDSNTDLPTNDCITHCFSTSTHLEYNTRRSIDVNAVKWFPDGQSFAVGSDDGTVRLYDKRSCHILNEFSYTNYIHSLNPNSNINNVQNNQNNQRTNNPNDSDMKSDPSPSSNQPMVGYDDEEETDGVSTLDFSKSGCFLFVSYNNDQHKVLVWNVLSGDVMQTLSHSGHVPYLSVSPKGDKLMTACWNHNLKIWKKPTKK